MSQNNLSAFEISGTNGKPGKTSVFPNPVKRGSDLQIRMGTPQLQSEVRVTDFMGQTVYHLPETLGSEILLSTGTLKPGTYLLQVIVRGEVKETKRVIIN